LSESKFAEDIKNALHNEHVDTSNIGFRDLSVTPVMEAELSGPGFNISPKAEQEIEISTTRLGTAVWTITALPGDDLGYQLSAQRTVHVTVYALIKLAGKERPRRVDSLDHNIAIEVGPLEWFEHTEELAEKGGWVIASCVAVGGTVSGLTGWRHQKKKRSKRKA
jgi:hypothetical protein